MRMYIVVIDQARKVKEVAGVHIMAVEWEDAVPEIVQQARLYPRPTL